MTDLKNKTIIITGASRGIGREIALRFAEDGANIVVIAKTAEPHPKLSGTIHSVADEIKAAGGKALAIQADIRDDRLIEQAVQQTLDTFGGIDVLVNNASALNVTSTLNTPIKRFDLMFGVNVRATFAFAQACIPHLKNAQNPHILTISPPINLNPKWLKDTLVYTMSKYGMSMCTLGLAAEFAQEGIAANSLWPKYVVDTVAITANFPPHVKDAVIKPRIVADAAHTIVTSDSRKMTGNFFLDEDVLKTAGMTDIGKYLINPAVKPIQDFYIDN